MSYSSESYKGDSAESLFMSECILRGYSVSIPFGHNNSYDLIVESTSLRLYKVQIKMSKEAKFMPILKYKGRIDAFGFLVGDSWYVIPANKISDREYNLKTFRLNLKKYLQYKEAFYIFV